MSSLVSQFNAVFALFYHFILPVGDYVNITKNFIWLNTVALYTFNIFVERIQYLRILAYRKRLFVLTLLFVSLFPE